MPPAGTLTFIRTVDIQEVGPAVGLDHVHDGLGHAGLQVVLQAAFPGNHPAARVGGVVEEDEGDLQTLTLRVGPDCVQRGPSSVAQQDDSPFGQQGAHCPTDR